MWRKFFTDDCPGALLGRKFSSGGGVISWGKFAEVMSGGIVRDGCLDPGDRITSLGRFSGCDGSPWLTHRQTDRVRTGIYHYLSQLR